VDTPHYILQGALKCKFVWLLCIQHVNSSVSGRVIITSRHCVECKGPHEFFWPLPFSDHTGNDIAIYGRHSCQRACSCVYPIRSWKNSFKRCVGCKGTCEFSAFTLWPQAILLTFTGASFNVGQTYVTFFSRRMYEKKQKEQIWLLHIFRFLFGAVCSMSFWVICTMRWTGIFALKLCSFDSYKRQQSIWINRLSESKEITKIKHKK
jgi:hypothetical protein